MAIGSPVGMSAITTIEVIPGKLQDQFLDLNERPTELKLTGSINATDIQYINTGTGKIGSVTTLDLSEVKLAVSDESYNATRIGSTGIGMGSINVEFCISNECRTDTVSAPGSLGGGSVIYRIYSNSLAGGFIGNQTLKSVVLPKTLPSIGTYMFSGSAIESVTLPDAPSLVERRAFANTTGLTALSLPGSITGIEEGAFQGSSIASINIPAACKEIGESAFSGAKLTSVNLSKVERLGHSAFNGVPLQGTLDLSNFAVIPSQSFSHTEISAIKFSQNLKTIESSAFLECDNLKSISLPEGLEDIGSKAFYNCRKLTDINLPNSLISVGANAFPAEWSWKLPSENGIIYIGKTAYMLASDPTPMSELKFKEGTVSIASRLIPDAYGASESVVAFRDAIKKIVFPSSLLYIGDKTDCWGYCFQNLKNLEEVELNDGLLMIGHYAFYKCEKLDINHWPESLKYIGARAFPGAKIGLLTLPKNLEYIGFQSFDGCNFLYEVKLNSQKLYVGSETAYLDDPYAVGMEYCFFSGAGLEKVTIGSEVERIPGNFLPYSMPNLRRFVVEKGETPIEVGDGALKNLPLTITDFPRPICHAGRSAFSGCKFANEPDLSLCRYYGSDAFAESSGIISLSLDSDIQMLGEGAFNNVSTLKTLYYNIPSSENFRTDKYSYVLFSGCNNLSAITIGPDVEMIGAYEFSGLKELKEVYFQPRTGESRGTPTPLLIDDQAFRSSALRTIIFPDCRTALGEYVFGDCTYLKTVRFGDGLENIGRRTFYFSGIEYVDFPASFKAFTGDDVFERANNLKAVYFHSSDVPAGFMGVSFNKSAVVYVPANAVDNYKKYTLQEVVPYAIENFTIDKTELSLKSDQTDLLRLTIAPQEYSGLNVVWTSSDSSVASVDYNGKVTAHATGTATITASTAFMSGYEASCKVMVNGGSGIDDVTTDNRISIFVEDGSLIVKGAAENSELRVYSISGLLVYAGKEHRVCGLAQGIYIVNIEGITSKIVIK